LSIGGILAAGIGGALGGILMIRKRTAPSGAST